MATDTLSKFTALDVTRVKSLEAELKAAREEVRRGLLQSIEKQIAELREIGFDYQLNEITSRRRRAPTQVDKTCPICGAKGHDRRAHMHKKKKVED
jgi:DNA repair exonuclease SbcCD ATPase subunit